MDSTNTIQVIVCIMFGGGSSKYKWILLKDWWLMTALTGLLGSCESLQLKFTIWNLPRRPVISHQSSIRSPMNMNLFGCPSKYETLCWNLTDSSIKNTQGPCAAWMFLLSNFRPHMWWCRCQAGCLSEHGYRWSVRITNRILYVVSSRHSVIFFPLSFSHFSLHPLNPQP